MKKYKIGTLLKVVRPLNILKKGEIVKIVMPKEYYSSYTLQRKVYMGYFDDMGWDPAFVDNEDNFEPIKITNWRQRIK